LRLPGWRWHLPDAIGVTPDASQRRREEPERLGNEVAPGV